MKFEFSRWIFKKKKIKFQIKFNSSHESRFIPCGRADEQTDEHDETNIRFSQFSKRP